MAGKPGWGGRFSRPVRPPQGPWGLRGHQRHCICVYGAPPVHRGLLLSCLVMTTAQMGHSRAGAQATRPKDRPTATCQAGVCEAPASAPARAKLGREGSPARCPRQRGGQGPRRQADPGTEPQGTRSPGRGSRRRTMCGREGPAAGVGAEPRPGHLWAACLRFPTRRWMRRPVGRAHPAPRQAPR